MGLAGPQGSLATDDHNRPIFLKFRSLSDPFLKLFKVADVTALLSRAFHMLMMRSVKKYFLKSVLNLFLRNFMECPRVLPLVSYSKKPIEAHSRITVHHLVNLNQVSTFTFTFTFVFSP